MSSRPEFWDTMKILVERDFKRNISDDVSEWLDNFVKRWETEKEDEEMENSDAVRKRPLSECSDLDIQLEENIQKFLKALDKKLKKVDCSFSHPQIRSRLEKLMGSNRVSLTDRKYMLRLQERILEEYGESMDKRIKAREEEELERVKNLVLIGKIPMDEAPPEMAKHPVMLIEKYCNKVIAERRAKIKIAKVKIPTQLYYDDTPDPESGLTIEKGHAFRSHEERMCIQHEKFLEPTEEEEIEKGYMMTKEELESIKYEDPLVKKLFSCETVEEMYTLADEIIGTLTTIDESAKVQDDVSENES